MRMKIVGDEMVAVEEKSQPPTLGTSDEAKEWGNHEGMKIFGNEIVSVEEKSQPLTLVNENRVQG